MAACHNAEFKMSHCNTHLTQFGFIHLFGLYCYKLGTFSLGHVICMCSYGAKWENMPSLQLCDAEIIVVSSAHRARISAPSSSLEQDKI